MLWSRGSQRVGHNLVGLNNKREIGIDTYIYTTMYKIDSQWGAPIYHRELSSALCDDLEGWDGGEVQEGEEICIHIADLSHCRAETNTALGSNYTPIN